MTADQIYQCIRTPERLNRDTLPFLKELTEQHPAFEAGWILYLKNLKNLNDSSFEQELLHGAIRIQDRRKLYLFLNGEVEIIDPSPALRTKPNAKEDIDIYGILFTEEQKRETQVVPVEPVPEVTPIIKKRTSKKIGLIEKFIEAQPKMPPAKELASMPLTENKKLKEEENDDLVTETLASIYANQGYYKKAIQIFEKLSLKYPEKSTYFGGQIEKIKNLMNN